MRQAVTTRPKSLRYLIPTILGQGLLKLVSRDLEDAARFKWTDTEEDSSRNRCRARAHSWCTAELMQGRVFGSIADVDMPIVLF